MTNRVSQKDIFPSAITNRLFGDIVLIDDSSSASFSLTPGEEVFVVFTTLNKFNARMFVSLSLSLYENSISSQNQFFSGTNVNESEYQIIGPFSDWLYTDNRNVKTKIYIRNLSSSTKNLIIVGRSRYIINPII